MKLRKTWLRSATARILASASSSLIGAGRASGCADLMLAGHDGVGHRVQRVVADDAQHVRDLGVVGADVAFEERTVVLELAQGGGVRHGRHPGRAMEPGARKPHVGCPSVLLPESLEARRRGGRVLRAPSAPALPRGGRSLQSVVAVVVSGLSDYGRLRLRQPVAGDGLLPPVLPADYSLRAGPPAVSAYHVPPGATCSWRTAAPVRSVPPQ